MLKNIIIVGIIGTSLLGNIMNTNSYNEKVKNIKSSEIKEVKVEISNEVKRINECIDLVDTVSINYIEKYKRGN